MSESRLRGALDLLFTEEPVLDLYSYGRWEVPAGLVEELAARIDALARDRRSVRLTLAQHPFLRTPAPAVVADVLGIVGFLCGDAAVRGGSSLRLEHDLVAGYRAAPALFDPSVRWVAPASSWRPPGGELFRAAGGDRELRKLAWELTVDVLRELAEVDPLEARRQALLTLFEQAAEDPDLHEATLSAPYLPSEWTRLEERWADTASDDLVRTLPELTGPVGYLSWIVDGWSAAHEQLAAVVPGGEDVITAFIQLLVQAGATDAPAELAVGIRGELYGQVQDRLPGYTRSWNARAWQRHLRAWLARALVAGEFDLARAWLDLAVRLTGAVQGLPGKSRTPGPCLVPVGAFQDDVRRLFRVRRVRHPLTGTTSMQGWLAAEDVFPSERGVDAEAVADAEPTEEPADDVREVSAEPAGEERAGTSSPVEPAEAEPQSEPQAETEAETGAEIEVGPGADADFAREVSVAEELALAEEVALAEGRAGTLGARNGWMRPTDTASPLTVPHVPEVHVAESVEQREEPEQPAAAPEQPASEPEQGPADPEAQDGVQLEESREQVDEPAEQVVETSLEESTAGESTDVAQTDVAQTDVAQTDVAQTDVAQTDVAQTDVEDAEEPADVDEAAGVDEPAHAEPTVQGADTGAVDTEEEYDFGLPPAAPQEPALTPPPVVDLPESPAVAVEETPAPERSFGRASALTQATAMIDRIVGQPALVAVLREMVEIPAQDLRLLISGPPDVGGTLAVDVLARLMTLRGFDGTAVWLHHEQFARLAVSQAVEQFRDRIEGCDGERLIAIDGLDQLVSYETVGRPLAQELHRLISVHGAQVQIVAFGAQDGYRRLVNASPALAAWWRVVRTRDFEAADFATLFGLAVERHGVAVTPDAVRLAGELLAATPPDGRLRNASLAAYLADVTVDSARRRTNGTSAPTVDLPDLPQLGTDAPPRHSDDANRPGLLSRFGRPS